MSFDHLFLPFGFGVFNHSIPLKSLFVVPEERLLNILNFYTVKVFGRFKDVPSVKFIWLCVSLLVSFLASRIHNFSGIIIILQRFKRREVPSITRQYLTSCILGSIKRHTLRILSLHTNQLVNWFSPFRSKPNFRAGSFRTCFAWRRR